MLGHLPEFSTLFRKKATASSSGSDSHAKALGAMASQPTLVLALKERAAFLTALASMGGRLGSSRASLRHGSEVRSWSLVHTAAHSVRSSLTMAWGDAVRHPEDVVVAISTGGIPSRLVSRCAIGAPLWSCECTKVCHDAARCLDTESFICLALNRACPATSCRKPDSQPKSRALTTSTVSRQNSSTAATLAIRPL